MKRITDAPYGAYTAHTASTSGGIWVKCSKCSGTAIVTAGKDAARLHCTRCGSVRETGLYLERFSVQNQCGLCGRYYKFEPPKEARQFPVLRVSCPYCGHKMPGRVQKSSTKARLWPEIRDARDPYFGCELWFLAWFDGRPVWAVNRAHLQYLIDYLRAGLREKPPGGYGKTQADLLPTFMKTAKNRRRIVKLLKKMQAL